MTRWYFVKLNYFSTYFSVVHPPLLLELMLSIMELILEDMELLDGTLTTPTLLELMPKDAVKKRTSK